MFHPLRDLEGKVVEIVGGGGNELLTVGGLLGRAELPQVLLHVSSRDILHDNVEGIYNAIGHMMLIREYCGHIKDSMQCLVQKAIWKTRDRILQSINTLLRTTSQITNNVKVMWNFPHNF